MRDELRQSRVGRWTLDVGPPSPSQPTPLLTAHGTFNHRQVRDCKFYG